MNTWTAISGKNSLGRYGFNDLGFHRAMISSVLWCWWWNMTCWWTLLRFPFCKIHSVMTTIHSAGLLMSSFSYQRTEVNWGFDSKPIVGLTLQCVCKFGDARKRCHHHASVFIHVVQVLMGIHVMSEVNLTKCTLIELVTSWWCVCTGEIMLALLIRISGRKLTNL